MWPGKENKQFVEDIP